MYCCNGINLAGQRKGWCRCQETFCTLLPGVKAVGKGRRGRKSPSQEDLVRKETETSEKERETAEREELGRRLSDQNSTASSDGQMVLKLQNFLLQERTLRISGEEGLCTKK